MVQHTVGLAVSAARRRVGLVVGPEQEHGGGLIGLHGEDACTVVGLVELDEVLVGAGEHFGVRLGDGVVVPAPAPVLVLLLLGGVLVRRRGFGGGDLVPAVAQGEHQDGADDEDEDDDGRADPEGDLGAGGHALFLRGRPVRRLLPVGLLRSVTVRGLPGSVRRLWRTGVRMCPRRRDVLRSPGRWPLRRLSGPGRLLGVRGRLGRLSRMRVLGRGETHDRYSGECGERDIGAKAASTLPSFGSQWPRARS